MLSTDTAQRKFYGIANKILLLIILITGINQSSLATSITTYAGNAYSGDTEGVKGVARLRSPYSLVKNASGEIFSINLGHNISKLNPDGSIKIIAGSGSAGNQDGTGLNAQFNSPRFGAFDSVGNLYVTDYSNHSIRKININTGEVTTYTGSSSGYQDGSLASALFKNPTGIAIDSDDNIYVSDYGNRRIRKIDTNNGIVSTYAGSGSGGFTDGEASIARFNQPQGLAINDNDEVFVSDYANRRIRKIHDINGTLSVTTVAGNGTYGDTVGPALDAEFRDPIAISFAHNGSLLISDRSNYKVKKLNFNTNTISKLAGSVAGYRDGNEDTAMFQSPHGLLELDSDVLLVVDYSNHVVRKLDLNASYLTPIVSTHAGRNIRGNTDGELGLNRLNTPRGIVKDSLGNIYFSDSGNHRIRKIDTAGNVTTFAGSSRGLLDSNGVNAQFDTPTDLVIDSADNLYVADWGNHRIRKIDTAANVTTYAGSSSGFSDGVGATAEFNRPRGLAIDSAGVIYVADYNNHRIRKIETDQTVTTISGTGSASLIDGLGSNARHRNPFDIEIDSSGDLYVSDYGNHAIRKLSESSGSWVTTTVAGGIGSGNTDGPALEALLAYPAGLTFDSTGNLFIADRSNQKIRVLNTSNNIVSLLGTGFSGFSDGTASEASFSDPEYLLIDGDQLLISDSSNHRIREVDLSNLTIPSNSGSSQTDSDLKVSTLTGFLGTGNFRDGSTDTAYFRNPYGMTYDASGNLYLADRSNHRIRKITEDGNVSTFAGSSAGLLDGKAIGALFKHPTDLVFDSIGNLFITDYSNHVIRKITPSGDTTIFAGNGSAGYADGLGTAAQFRNPFGITIDSSDNLYVTDYSNNKIRKITPTGLVSTVAGSNGGFRDGDVSQARFNRPQGITINSSGDIYIADTNNNRIRKISGSSVSTFSGVGSAGFNDGPANEALFYNPGFIKFDSTGNLLVADPINNRIRSISPNGRVSTIAGTGIQGFKDTDAHEAMFNRPRGLVINTDGDIFVSEDSHRIRMLSEKEIIQAPDPIVIYPRNTGPIIEMISEITFDEFGKFTIREGTNLNIRVFAYDFEDGVGVKNNLTWESNLDGILAEGISKLDTSELSVGTHFIRVSTYDSEGEETYLHFVLIVIDSETDLGDGEGGGADRNGDGVIDQNDRILIPQSVSNQIIRITKPGKSKLKRRSRRAKLRAVALDLDDLNNVEADLSSQIIWELGNEDSESSEDSELKVFLAEGPVLKVRRLSKGLHTVYARVGDTQTSIRVKVTRRKVIILDE